jgi:hypothetical protein
MRGVREPDTAYGWYLRDPPVRRLPSPEHPSLTTVLKVLGLAIPDVAQEGKKRPAEVKGRSLWMTAVHRNYRERFESRNSLGFQAI